MNDNLILVVEDDSNLRDALCDTLTLSNYQTVNAENAENALKLLESTQVNLIISDVQMPGMDGHKFLSIVKRQYPNIPFVLITAFGTVAKAVDAIQSGAADYIVKPFEATVLIEMVNRLALCSIDTGNMVIEDKRSKDLADLSRRVAATDVSVMITGESGTGKEVYSKYIHEFSNRHEQPFLAINCAAIPESMLESLLFGYEKGAFTGAYSSRAGKFEQANKGTLLLDEISEMDISLQAKLLRVIQEKEVERLGGSKTIPLDVRIIATTNRNLKEEVAAGNFREDLYYRLNVFPLHLAPLRERRDDIVPLAQKFLEHYSPGNATQINDDAKNALLSHYWRGNVRELENVIQRALILKSGNSISADDINFENIADTCSLENVKNQLEDSDELANNLKNKEKEIIIDTLATHSSRKEAAEKLGISPRTLRYKLAQFRKEGITIPSMPSALRAT
ncbi:MAG: sigma-54-dependent Fis family transcriptional regulator [SAR86 cluster bacterium]|uniref:Sigma-54-dependent Fis family transcriptional regulator n=1 Tax=SAR86 cluster bacterium TaxID=2030880 RepID=A0A2A5CBB4_9GAMM|nr:sigma-54-dependent Fis family transcriptional regulator [Gammaproteobacteria bacterium AH-315-E17]PCJ40855.1 MAG: sigma-54-dependent Fis family transcriptional regulator [SAR86 cluster bacterium]